MKHVPLEILAMAAVLACVVSPVLAQNAAKPDWMISFRAHDRNGDGRIDRAEFRDWMVDSFFILDKGEKGYLDYDDVKGLMSPKIFKAQDKDRDGKISLQEFLNASIQDFLAADVGRSGALTMEEFEVYFKQTGR